MEPTIDELDVGVLDQVGPAHALPVGVFDGQVGCDFHCFLL